MFLLNGQPKVASLFKLFIVHVTVFYSLLFVLHLRLNLLIEDSRTVHFTQKFHADINTCTTVLVAFCSSASLPKHVSGDHCSRTQHAGHGLRAGHLVPDVQGLQGLLRLTAAAFL